MEAKQIFSCIPQIYSIYNGDHVSSFILYIMVIKGLSLTMILTLGHLPSGQRYIKYTLVLIQFSQDWYLENFSLNLKCTSELPFKYLG